MDKVLAKILTERIELGEPIGRRISDEEWQAYWTRSHFHRAAERQYPRMVWDSKQRRFVPSGSSVVKLK